MTTVTWILVADGTRARIFSARAHNGGLAEIVDLLNPEARERDDELASYSGGEGRPGARTATQQKSAADHSIGRFSKLLSDYLDSARIGHRYDRVTLVAGPKLLGHLRDDLPAEVRKLVAGEVVKDVSWFNTRDLERYVQSFSERSSKRA